MMRGTFANIRLKNRLVPGSEGNVTVHFPSGEKMSIYDAAMAYAKTRTPLVAIAGREYGTGSSRDWAAKGTALLGVRAVIAESYERIHRGNLVGMGVLPLQFREGEGADALGLAGRETFDIAGISDAVRPGEEIAVRATREDGSRVDFAARCRLDLAVEIETYRHGGILPQVVRDLLR
jgi:aconitate hydratase